MNNIRYSLPGMPDWSFQAPNLRHTGGARFTLTPEMQPQEIADAIKKILRKTQLPDEAAFELAAQASKNISWKAMFESNPMLVAPLINAAPATPVPATPPNFVDTTALGEEIVDLVRKTEQAWGRLRKINQC